MHNRVINLALVAQVAKGLEELKDKMVFIGGAVVSLYTDDPAADEIRPTSDIDMTINLANYSEWAVMQERLAELNFYPDPQGQSICSYKYQDIIDIMPADDSSIGVSNSWYKPGFKLLQSIHDYEDIIYFLDNRTTIVEEILTAENDVKEYIKQELLAIKKHPQA